MSGLEELIQSYREELPRKTAAIRRAADEAILRLGHRTTPSWDALASELHRLAGSSGTYGFPLLGDVARHLEDLIADGTFARLDPASASAHLRLWSARFVEAAAAVATRAPEPSRSGLIRLAEDLRQRLGHREAAA